MPSPELSTELAQVAPDRLLVGGVPVADIVDGYSFEDLVCLLLGLEIDAARRDVLRACLVVNSDHGRASNATTAAVATTATARNGVPAGTAAGLLAIGSASISPRDTMVFLRRCVADRARSGDALAAFAQQRVQAQRRNGGRIPGFGSPFHPDGDPRVPPLRQVAVRAGTWGEHGAMFDALGTALAAEGRPLPANEVGMTGACLADLGLDPDQGEAVAVIGTVPSLVANVVLECRRAPRFVLAEEYAGVRRRRAGGGDAGGD